MPTRDRPDALRRCLDALGRQSLAAHEVIVVDDGSRSPTAVESVVAAVPNARLLRAAGRGPAAARNLGARAAEGRIVCLLDDDCEPEPRWLERLTAALATGADVAAGRTVAPTRARAFTKASQAIASGLAEATHEPRTGGLGFAPSCNLACRRETLAAVPFDERFPIAAGEDREWCARLLAGGLRLVYAPEAVVLHDQRLTPRGFLRQQLRYGRGARRYQHAAGVLGEGAPRVQLVMLRRALAHGPAAAALVLLAQLATACGFALAALAERRA